MSDITEGVTLPPAGFPAGIPSPALEEIASEPEPAALDPRAALARRVLRNAEKDRKFLKECFGIDQELSEIIQEAGFADLDLQSELIRSGRSRRVVSQSVLKSVLSWEICDRLALHPIELVDGVLSVAALRPLSEADHQEIIQDLARHNFEVDRIEQKLVDQREILRSRLDSGRITHERVEADVQEANGDPNRSGVINRVLNDILCEAFQARASDIAIDSGPGFLDNRIHYRLDGDLSCQHRLTPDAMRRLISRVKSNAGLDTANRQVPMDGRFSFTYQDRSIDVRVNTLPTEKGETVALRILDNRGIQTLQDMYRHMPDLCDRLMPMLDRTGKRGGIIFVTGPTGSGKTTAINACLTRIDRIGRKVFTVEDPVEQRLAHARQVAAQDQDGCRFADIARALMRQDLDVGMIGEIRDRETAEIAMKLAESGHLMFSTTHTDSAVEALERVLTFFPLEYAKNGAYLLSRTVQAILNQRLVKVPCRYCRDEIPAHHAFRGWEFIMETAGIDPNESLLCRGRKADQCEMCLGTGYRGRVAAVEYFFVDGDDATRRAMAHFLEEGDLTALKGDGNGMDGVTYVSLASSIFDLLRQRQIDLAEALNYLPNHLVEAARQHRQMRRR